MLRFATAWMVLQGIILAKMRCKYQMQPQKVCDHESERSLLSSELHLEGDYTLFDFKFYIFSSLIFSGVNMTRCKQPRSYF